MAEPYMRVEGLVKRFGPFTALGGVDLAVKGDFVVEITKKGSCI